MMKNCLAKHLKVATIKIILPYNNSSLNFDKVFTIV
jgi:hypothetical protein